MFSNPEDVTLRSFGVNVKGKDRYFWYRWRKSYINWVDDYFEEVQHISHLPQYTGNDFENFERIKFKQIRGHNVVKLAKKALSDSNEKDKTPHTRIEKYFLMNDPKTVAVELPLWSKNLNMFGFVDILRVKNHVTQQIQILDFKTSVNEKKVGTQLQKYRLMLSERMAVPPSKIDIGYFTKNAYFEEKIKGEEYG